MIDADIRKSIHKRYEIKGNPSGLSQYLSGQKTMDDICYATDVENFDMILAGPYSPNPAELLKTHYSMNYWKKPRRNMIISS